MAVRSRPPWTRLGWVGLAISSWLSFAGPARALGVALTQAQLAQLVKVTDREGTFTRLPPTVTSALELQARQVEPAIKEVAYVDEAGVRHGFAALNDSSGYFLFHRDASNALSLFHVDSQLKLVRAAHSFVNDRLVSLPESDAVHELSEEFASWSKVLKPAGPTALRPQGPAAGGGSGKKP